MKTSREALYTSVSTRCDVDVDLVAAISDLSDKERARLLRILGADQERDDDLYVTRAYEALMGSRAAEALAYLESYLFPPLVSRIPEIKAKAKADRGVFA